MQAVALSVCGRLLHRKHLASASPDERLQTVLPRGVEATLVVSWARSNNSGTGCLSNFCCTYGSNKNISPTRAIQARYKVHISRLRMQCAPTNTTSTRLSDLPSPPKVIFSTSTLFDLVIRDDWGGGGD